LGILDVVRAHAHSIWLAACGLDLRASMVDLIDIEETNLPLRAAVWTTISSPTAKSEAATAITDVLSATPEVTQAPWWKPDWIVDTVDRAPARFNEAADRWRTLYREALNDLDQANKVLKEIGASEPAKRAARARIVEARAALDLLRGQVDDIVQSDFYPYRYFASEGFLPGYSFPRLPLAAFIPADRKTAHGQGDYVQRPRFVAISEFGPNAFIYHEGARYEVDRVSLPTRDDGGGVNITEIKRCNVCGYLHENAGSVELCHLCGSGSLETLSKMMRLMSVKTRRRDRISADEEERQRAGYEIVTSIRFVPHGERAGQVTSSITVDGDTVGAMTYGDTALIRRMNVGLRRRKDKHVKGYLLDTLEGRWAREADLAKNVEGQDPRIRSVIPYVEDRRNAMMVELDPSINEDQRRALMYALKRAIEAIYQLESSELAVEPLPGHTGDHAWSRLLFFEAAEGGAGVLRRVATEDGQLALVARKALELLHFNPDTGEDLHRAEYARENCAQACYDCLLSYSNQWDHQHLDRHTVVELLRRLMRAQTTMPPDEPPADDQFQKLITASNSLESQFLKVLKTHGYRLPDEAQQIVEGYYVRPDFAYHPPGMDVAVFIDGPVHEDGHQQTKDEQARAKLEDELGWLVLRFDYGDAEQGWLDTIAAHPDVFGTGKTGA
jgi:very-short-patch-repair endonuclease